MDCDTAGYKKARYEEVRDEMINMMTKVGWKKEFIDASVPVMPISGWIGDNLIKKSEKMDWWTGVDVKNQNGQTVHVHTLLDALNDFVCQPTRDTDKVLRLPISGIYKIKGVGDVLAGRVEQGTVVPDTNVIFMPTHTAGVPCKGKVFTVEMHHKRVDKAGPGDNVGMNVKGLDKNNMPHTGDVMILESDKTLKHNKNFTAQVQTLDIPGEIKKGYSPIGFVRCGRAACKLLEIEWKMGKETGGKKVEGPNSLKSNEMAQVTFEPIQPLIVDSFKNCEGLSRIAFLDGNTAVMLGKIVKVETKDA
jgi:elongation factor 1-alpha